MPIDLDNPSGAERTTSGQYTARHVSVHDVHSRQYTPLPLNKVFEYAQSWHIVASKCTSLHGFPVGSCVKLGVTQGRCAHIEQFVHRHTTRNQNVPCQAVEPCSQCLAPASHAPERHA